MYKSFRILCVTFHRCAGSAFFSIGTALSGGFYHLAVRRPRLRKGSGPDRRNWYGKRTGCCENYSRPLVPGETNFGLSVAEIQSPRVAHALSELNIKPERAATTGYDRETLHRFLIQC